MVELPGGGETEPQNVTIDYTYDPLHRLTDADYDSGEYFHYAYDEVGNRLTQETQAGTNAYTYDIANRLTEVDGVSYTWSTNGNLISDDESTYTYDHINRLTDVTRGEDTYSYVYNGLGDRLQQTINGEATSSYTLDTVTGLTQVLDDGTNAYLYGLDRVGEQQPTGWAYHIPDALGSVRQLTDVDADVTLAQSYEPFGSVMSSSGPGEMSYSFTGEWADGTGLVHLRARYYAPWQGNFISKDTWGGYYEEPQSLVSWTYVLNNPIRYTDPSGYLHQDDEDEANRIAESLISAFNVRIYKDWGWMITPIPHPEPPDPSNPEHECYDPFQWKSGRWELAELKLVEFAIVKLAIKMQGTARFRDFVGYVEIYKTPIDWRGLTVSLPLIPTFILLNDAGKPVTMENYTIPKIEDVNFDAWSVVHELAHTWDFNSGKALSRGLEKFTKGLTDPLMRDALRGLGLCNPPNYREPGCNDAGYYYGGIPPAGANYVFNREEDFAESVATYLFPGAAHNKLVKLYERDEIPEWMVWNTYTGMPRWQYVHNLMRSWNGVPQVED